LFPIVIVVIDFIFTVVLVVVVVVVVVVTVGVFVIRLVRQVALLLLWVQCAWRVKKVSERKLESEREEAIE
jgi:hypothetical protein